MTVKKLVGLDPRTLTLKQIIELNKAIWKEEDERRLRATIIDEVTEDGARRRHTKWS